MQKLFGKDPRKNKGDFRKKKISKFQGNDQRDLSGSKFRFLNELMYKQDSKDLQDYFNVRTDDFKDVG
jgi:hypothetical protein